MKYFILVMAFSIPSFGYSFPLPTPGLTPQFSPLFTVNYDFTGIVALSNCSASYVRFETSQETDLGLMLTNGHCYEGGFIRPGQVLHHRKSSLPLQFLSASGAPVGRLRALQLLYGTMTKTDMALYQLPLSFFEINQSYNIKPLTLASEIPSPGTPISIISGYHRRGFSCLIDQIVHQLREGDWLMEQSIRYSQPGCEIFPGTSGSPVISQLTGEVIAINNTGNEGARPCTENNPCEVDVNGNISSVPDAAYAQQTYWLYSCLNDSRDIDLTLPQCLLPK